MLQQCFCRPNTFPPIKPTTWKHQIQTYTNNAFSYFRNTDGHNSQNKRYQWLLFVWATGWREWYRGKGHWTSNVTGQRVSRKSCPSFKEQPERHCQRHHGLYYSLLTLLNGRALVIVPQVDTATSEALRYMARTKQRRTYLPYTFPAVAGTHLPTPRGWRVE